MEKARRQVVFKVDGRDYDNYVAFARRLGFAPYHMLKLLVETWAGAEELMRRLESGTASQPEAYTELGRLVGHAQKVARLNGVFEECMRRVATHYGMDVKLFQAALTQYQADIAGKTNEQ